MKNKWDRGYEIFLETYKTISGIKDPHVFMAVMSMFFDNWCSENGLDVTNEVKMIQLIKDAVKTMNEG